MQSIKSIFFKDKYSAFRVEIIIISVGFFCIGFFFFVCVFSFREFSVSIIQSLSTLAAAFFGAWFAFLLQSKSKKEEEINKQVSVCNRAVFTLFQRTNKLLLYQRQNIDPHRKHPAIFLAIGASRDFEKDDTSFDIHNLNFFIDYNKPQLLLDLYIADQRFKTAVSLINSHFELHFNSIQPRLEQFGFKENQCYLDLSFFKNALGSRLYVTLERTVDDLIDSIDKAIESNIKVKDELKIVFKSMFHDKVFMDFEIINKNEPAPSSPDNS